MSVHAVCLARLDVVLTPGHFAVADDARRALREPRSVVGA